MEADGCAVPVRSTVMDGERRRGPGLHSRGNRILLGIAVGFVAQIFAGLLGASPFAQLVVWVVVAVITIAIATPRGQAGTDSSR